MSRPDIFTLLREYDPYDETFQEKEEDEKEEENEKEEAMEEEEE